MLASRLPDGTVSTDPQTLRQHATDSWPLALLRRVRGDDLPEPAAVALPGHHRGSRHGPGLGQPDGHRGRPEGRGLRRLRRGQARTHDAVVLDLSRMDRIGAVDPDLPDGRGPGRGARRPPRGGTGRKRPDHRPLPAVGRDLHRRRLDRRVVGRAGLHRVRRDRGRAARADRGPAGRRDPAPAPGAALGRRPGPEKTPHRLGGDARRRHRGDARLPGSPHGLGVAGLRLRRLHDPGRSPERRQASRDRRRRPARLRRDRRPAGLRRPEPHDRVRGAGRLPRPAGPPGLDARKQAAAAILQTSGTELGARYGEHWWQHRNDAVQTFAQIMGPERTFGTGVIVDTMEVAGLWSAVPRLYDEHQSRPVRARPGGGLPPVPPVPVRLVAVLHLPDQRRRRPRGGNHLPRGLAAGRAQLHRSRRHDHPPSRRRPPQGAVPRPRTSARPEPAC